MADHQVPKFIKYDGYYYNVEFVRWIRPLALGDGPGKVTKFQFSLDGDTEPWREIDCPHDSSEGLALLSFLDGNTIFGVDLNSKALSAIPMMCGNEGAP
jgi:hypothetical protein